MNSKKISSSSSKSKLASKDLSRSIPKKHLDKLQIEYKSNSSSKSKDISDIWKNIFKTLFSFLKSKVSSPLFAEIQNFLKDELNKIKFHNPNLKSKDSYATIEEILKYPADTDINNHNSISIEIEPRNDQNKEDRKSSIERENFIKIKNNEDNFANTKQNLLNINKNSAEGASNIKCINNYTEQPSKTNIKINLNNKTAKTIPKQSNNIRDIAKINSNQNYSKPKDKYVSPQHSQLLIPNRFNPNLKKLVSKTNSESRSISKSKDSISLTKDKKSLANSSYIKQIGINISNSNNEDLIAVNKQHTNLSTVKFPKARSFKSSNMFSKINTRLKTKTGLSPDDINIKREKINNVFYPEDNNLKISNPMEYNPLAKQIESLTTKLKTCQNRDNDKKLSYAYNITNIKSDVNERKYSSNLKNPSQKLQEKPSMIKNLKIGSSYNSNSKEDIILDKKISQTNSLGKIPADLKLNHHNSFTGCEIDALKETGHSRSKLNLNQPNRIIDLTFGNKETSTGRFMSEERRLITSNMDNCEEKEKAISELFNEVKLNLDGNMKNIFNFSYENFNNENSDSVISYIKTDNSDVSEGRKDELIKVHYEVNEIGFDESEEKLKNILFKQDNK